MKHVKFQAHFLLIHNIVRADNVSLCNVLQRSLNTKMNLLWFARTHTCLVKSCLLRWCFQFLSVILLVVYIVWFTLVLSLFFRSQHSLLTLLVLLNMSHLSPVVYPALLCPALPHVDCQIIVFFIRAWPLVPLKWINGWFLTLPSHLLSFLPSPSLALSMQLLCMTWTGPIFSFSA